MSNHESCVQNLNFYFQFMRGFLFNLGILTVVGCGCQEAITQYDRSCQQSWGFVLEFIHIEQVSFFQTDLKREENVQYLLVINYLLWLTFYQFNH